MKSKHINKIKNIVWKAPCSLILWVRFSGNLSRWLLRKGPSYLYFKLDWEFWTINLYFFIDFFSIETLYDCYKTQTSINLFPSLSLRLTSTFISQPIERLISAENFSLFSFQTSSTYLLNLIDPLPSLSHGHPSVYVSHTNVCLNFLILTVVFFPL